MELDDNWEKDLVMVEVTDRMTGQTTLQVERNYLKPKEKKRSLEAKPGQISKVKNLKMQLIIKFVYII